VLTRLILLVFCCFLCAGELAAQVVINELSSRGGITDFRGIDSDWIELYNTGTTEVQLEGYSLSDDLSEPNKWSFPYIAIPPQERLLVLANGEDISVVSNYVSFAQTGDDWQYHIGDSAPPDDWNELNSSAANWPTAPSGFGYADEDDNTEIPFGSPSVFMRREFNIEDLDSLYWMYLHMDYDDGFIAYMNGTEIARSESMNGHNGDHDDYTNFDVEAVLQFGETPEEFVYDYEELIVEGTNVFAVQVHNISATSSDFSANPFLFASVNIATIEGTSDTDLPDWFFTPTFFLQTNFKLSKENESLQLYDNNGTLIDSANYPLMREGNSYGRGSDGGNEWCLFLEPSPEDPNLLSNSVCYTGYAQDAIMSPAPGFYNIAQTVSFECPDEDASAHFRTDGAVATDNDDSADSFEFMESVVLSVKCYSETKAPSEDVTGTYFINQPNFSLPVISLSTAPENLWDEENGIYVLGDSYEADYPFMGANFWQPWERDAHIEIFDLSNDRVVDLDMALEIHGGWSRAEPQKSFRIDTKKSIEGPVDYPLLSRKSGITSYNNFNLRNTGQVAYSNRFQDAFVAELVSDATDIDYMTHESSMVYLNGEFWGHYGIREKMDEHYIESNHGVDSKNVDLVSKVYPLVGSYQHFQETVDLALSTNIFSEEFYEILDTRIDLDNYIDYYATEIHIQNLDWGGIAWLINNTKLWRPQTEDGKWRYMLFDVDGALGNFGSGINENYLDRARSPGVPSDHSRLFNRVLINEKFRLRFINRYADLINTIFQPAHYNQVIDGIRDELEPDIPRQIARWGGPSSIIDWDQGITNMRSHLEGRENTSREHIREHFDLAAERVIQIDVQPDGAGRIQLNSISPETYPWNGIYFQGVPVTFTAIPNPGYSFETWSNSNLVSNVSAQSVTLDPLNNVALTASFTGSPEISDIVVSEINYHSSDEADSGDWIELYNPNDFPLDISNWTFEDQQFYNEFKIPVGTAIEANDYIVLASTLEKFSSIHPWVNNVVGDFEFQLSNDGERIAMRDHAAVLKDELVFNDAEPWPSAADGEGYTLELFDLTSDPNEPGSWTSECFLGSPGREFNSACIALSDIETTSASEGIDIFPNPATNQVRLSLPIESSLDFDISLKDATGKRIEIGKRRLESGSVVSLPKLPNGVYILSLVSSEIQFQEKLIIQY